MRSPVDTLRFSVGGGACGGYVGAASGFLVGMTVGIIVGDAALGLDGALLGMAFLALAGIVAGAILGREEPPNDHSKNAEARRPGTAQDSDRLYPRSGT